MQKAAAHLVKGELGLAAQYSQAILAEQPNNPDGLQLLGAVSLMIGGIDGAIDLLTRAARGKPGDPAIRCNLANALMQAGDPASAELHLRKALKGNPDHPPAVCLLAACRAALGDMDDARQLYESVLARLPDHPQALLGLADLCVTTGDIERARSNYRRALALGNEMPLALAGLSACERLRKDSSEAGSIRRHLESPGLKPIEYLNLAFAAGGIADATGAYDEAFKYFSDAHQMSSASFDIEAQKRVFDELRTVFTPGFFEARGKKYGDASTRPVFIVGMPRSGTTLVEQIISRHPRAAAAGELTEMTRIAASLGFRRDDAKEFAKRVTKLTAPAGKALAKRYLSVLDRVSATALRVTDKMPHNFQQLGVIALLFPNARIIHCRRDPLDTCVSCFTTQLRSHNHGYTKDLAALGAYYRAYASLMDHWREVLPLAIHDLDYEKLIAAPEDESRKLIDFIGLSWDPACLAPHESSRPVSTQSRMQVRQPIYGSSVGRWRHYERHLAPLRSALGDLASVAPGVSERSGH